MTDDLEKALQESGQIHGLQLARQTLPDGFVLRDCFLYDADLQNADLSNCTFRNTEILESRFEGADLSGASFLPDEEMEGDFGVVRTWTDMNSNNFTDANLTRATFRRINLMDSVLDCKDMRSVTFVDCALSELKFEDQNLRDSDFSYSLLRKTIFDKCDLHNGTFQASVLDGTRYIDSNLRTADLRNAILDKPEFDSIQVDHQTQFDPYLAQEYLADRYCEGTLSEDDINDVREFLHNRRECIPMNFEALVAADGWTQKVVRSISRLLGQRPSADDGPDIGHLIHARYRYRDLSRVFSANEEPERAREYAIREKDAKRKNAFRTDDSSRIWLSLTRWTMTYGEEPTQPLRVAIAVVIISALLYPVWGVTPTSTEQVFGYCLECRPGIELLIQRAISIGELSIVRLFTPTNPSVKPVGFGVLLGLFESITGALLTAMFIFALGRRATE